LILSTEEWAFPKVAKLDISYSTVDTGILTSKMTNNQISKWTNKQSAHRFHPNVKR